MGLVKTETFFANDGTEMKRDTYANGTIIEYTANPPEPLPPEPTQADRIEESQLVIMEAMAEQYEQHQAERLTDMEVQATTYEAILALQEGGKV